MKLLGNVKTIQMHCLRWISEHMAGLVMFAGFILMYGAAGTMDYHTATGTADTYISVILLIVGLLLFGVGAYGKRKDF